MGGFKALEDNEQRKLQQRGGATVYLESEDAGLTWKQRGEALKTKFWLREIAFAGDTGLIVGERGTIARTDTNGTEWELISGFSYDMDEFGLADF